MIRFVNNGKFKFIASLTVAVIIVTVVTVVFSGFIGPPNAQISEFQNDVQVNIGSSYPGIVDIVNASIDKKGDILNAAITLKDPIVVFEDGESAQFDIILILENEEDVLQSYELIVDVNQTGLFGLVEDVQTKKQQPIQLIVEANLLKISTTLTELNSATKAEWNICSTYQKISGNKIMSCAWDFVPDQGLKTTVF
jgi:hypothetical protein